MRITRRQLINIISEEIGNSIEEPSIISEVSPWTVGALIVSRVAGKKLLEILYDKCKKLEIKNIAIYGYMKYLLGDTTPLTYKDFKVRGYHADLCRIIGGALSPSTNGVSGGFGMGWSGAPGSESVANFSRQKIVFGIIDYDIHGAGGIFSAWMNSIQGKGKNYDLAVCLGKAGVGGATICGEYKPGYGSSQAILRPQDRKKIGGSSDVRIYNEFDFSRMTASQQAEGLLYIIKFHLFDFIKVVEGEGEGGGGTGVKAKVKRGGAYIGGRLVDVPALIANTPRKSFMMMIDVPCGELTLPPWNQYPESKSARRACPPPMTPQEKLVARRRVKKAVAVGKRAMADTGEFWGRKYRKFFGREEEESGPETAKPASLNESITRRQLRSLIKEEIFKESRYFGMSVNDVLSYLEGFGNNTWIFFDTETTGLPGKEVYMGQLTNIGAVAVNPNNWDADPKILGEFNEMVEINPEVEKRRAEQDANPDPERKTSAWTISQALTNTGYHEWEGEYLDEQVVISNFINFVNSFPNPVLVAQNASFDMQWIIARSETSMKRYPVIDTMRIMQYFLIPLLRAIKHSSAQDDDAAQLLSKLQRGRYYSTSMGKVAAAYGIDTQNWHRALDDAKMLMQLLHHVVQTLRTGIDVDIGPEHAEAVKDIRDRQRRNR